MNCLQLNYASLTAFCTREHTTNFRQIMRKMALSTVLKSERLASNDTQKIIVLSSDNKINLVAVLDMVAPTSEE